MHVSLIVFICVCVASFVVLLWQCFCPVYCCCGVLCCVVLLLFSLFLVYVVCVLSPDRRSLYTRCLLDRAVGLGVIGHPRVVWGEVGDSEGLLCMLYALSYPCIR